MTIFSFGIGIQLEGDAAAEVNALSQALHGLNAAIESVDGDNVDVAPLTSGAVTEAAQEAGAAFQTLGQRTAGMTQEAQASSEALRAIVNARVDEALTDAADTTLLFARQMGLAEEDAQSLAQAIAMVGEESGRAGRRMDGAFSNKARALGRIGSGVMTLGRSLFDMAEGLRDLVTMGGPSKIQADLTRLTGQLGASRRETDALWEATGSLRDRLGNLVSDEAVSQTMQAVGAIGVGFMDLDEQTRQTASLMTGALRIDPAEVAAALGNARRLSVSLADVTDQAVEFQKLSKVPGLVQQLPTTLEAVARAQVRFAGTVRGGSREIISDIQRVAASYVKLLGKDAAQATEAASASYNRFMKGVQQNEDIFLGLAESPDEITRALMGMGRSFHDATALMELGARSPRDFAIAIKEMEASLHPVVFQRGFRRIVRSAEGAAAEMLALDLDTLRSQEAMDGLLQQKAEERARAEEARLGALKEDAELRAAPIVTQLRMMSDAMADSAQGAADRLQNALEGIGETLKRAVAPGVQKGLEDLAQLISDNAAGIDRFIKGLDPAVFARIQEGIAGLTTVAGAAGIAFTALGAILGPFAGLASGAGRGLTMLTQGLGAAAKPAAATTTALRTTQAAAAGTSGRLAGLGKGLLKVAGAAMLVEAGAEPAAASLRALSDASLVAGESGRSYGVVLDELTRGSLTTLDNLLFNIPSRLLGLEGGFSSLGSFFESLFTDLPKKAEDFAFRTVASIKEAFDPNTFWSLVDGVKHLGNSLLDAIGHAPRAILNVFQTTLTTTNDVVAGIVKGVARAFGVQGSMLETIDLFRDKLDYGFHLTFSILRGTFNAFLDWIVTTWAAGGEKIGFLTREQAASARAFSADLKKSSKDDQETLQRLERGITAREARIADLQREEAAIAAAGGEEAYRAQQASRESARDIRLARARKQFGMSMSDDVALATLTALEKLQVATRSTQTGAAPPASTPPPNVVPQDAMLVPAAAGGDLGAVPGTVSPAEIHRRAAAPVFTPPIEPAAARTPMQPGPIKVQLEVLVGRAASTLENVLRDLEFRVAHGGLK